jgi:rRNA biogenesis protein RRP5
MLCVLAECSDADVTLHLPHGLRSTVDAANISDVVLRRYRDALAKRLAAAQTGDDGDGDDDDDGVVGDDGAPRASAVDGLPVLSDFVRRDALLPCVVVSEGGKRGFAVSLLASRVNEGLSRALLTVGQALAGSVRSIEDRGYEVDIGFEDGTRGFLPRGDKDAVLRVGEPLLVYVASVGSGRAPVQLSQASTATLQPSPTLSLKTLRAGTLIAGQVLNELSNGFSIGFGGYLVATVESTHIPRLVTPRANASVKARVLFVDPASKRIAVSLLGHIVKAESAAAVLREDALVLSSIVETTMIERIKDVGAVLRLNAAPHRLCFVSRHHLADSGVNVETDAYDTGSEHRVRLLAESRLDGALQGVMRASVLASPIALIGDVKAGMVTPALIVKVLPRRLEVMLAENVMGVVLLRHMADVTPSNPAARFKERQTIACRVLKVEPERRRILLTAKPTIVDSTLPVIASFADAVPGTVTHGTISRVWPDRGVFVELCGGIGGLVPMRELSMTPVTNAASLFHEGQAVRCRVLNARAEDQRLLLTFLTLDESRATRSMSTGGNAGVAFDSLGIAPGVLCAGTVSQAAPDLVYVRLDLSPSAPSDASVVGVLHRNHMSDVVLREPREPLPAVGARVENLLVLRIDNARVVLTQKPSLVVPARAGALPNALADVQIGSVLPGYVAAVKPFGVFVGFHGGLSGLAPQFELQDDGGQRAPADLFAVGQSVRAYVRSLSDNASHGAPLQLSLMPSMCAAPPGAYLAALLAARSAGAAAPAMSVRPGAVVNAAVVSRGSDGSLKLQLPDGITGSVSASQVSDGRQKLDDDQERMNDDDGTARVGDKCKCVVLDVDAAQRTAIVSTRASLIASIGDSKAKRTLPSTGSAVDGAIVEAVVDDAFYVVSLPAAKALAYASAQDFNYRAAPTAKVGERVGGVAAVDGGRILLQMALPASQTGPAKRQRTSERAPALEAIVPGTLLEGDVISSGDRYVGVALGGALRGRLYMTEVSDDVVDDEPALSKLTVGQSIKCKALFIDQEDLKVKNLIQVTMRPSELARGAAAPLLPTVETLKVGQTLTARLRQCDTASQTVLVALSPQLKAGIDFLDCGMPPAQVSRKMVRVGVGLRCVVLSLSGERPQLAVAASAAAATKEPAVGAVLVGRVLAVEADGALRVQLPFARVGVVPNAPVLSIGQYVDVKVTGVKRGQPLSLALTDAGAALAAATSHESERVAQGAADALAEGDVVDAVVVATDENGVQLRIAGSIDARAHMRNVADEYVAEDALPRMFAPDSVVRARILSLNRSSSFAVVSLKRSTVEGTRFLRFEDLKRDLLMHGRVVSVADYGLFLSIDYSDNLVGLCHARNISDDERLMADDLRARFKRGDPFHCVVTQVREQERKFAVAIKESLVGPALAAARASGDAIAQIDNTETASNFVAHDASDSEDDADVDEANAKRAKHDSDDDDDDGAGEDVIVAPVAATSRKAKAAAAAVSVADLDAMLSRTSTTFDDTERRLLVAAAAKPSAIGVSFDEIEDDLLRTSKKRTVAQVGDADADAESSSHEDAAAAAGDSRKRRNVQAASLRHEEQVLERERALADNTAEVLTEVDHERAVTLEPTSARAWISFMSFHAANNALEAARAVASRALKLIPMSKEDVRLDVWLALLALELNFGTAESLDAAFARAVRQNDGESVHMRMASLYEKAGRVDDGVALLSTAAKKFGGSMRVWEALGRLQLTGGDVDGFQSTLQRALAELTPSDQMTVVGRFARLEYEFGAVERGRTLFEGIVANHPKRIDQWNIYADTEVKFGDTESARRVYERLAGQRLSSKKMRAALKQWLKFEQQHGTDADADRVRQKARDYVQEQAALADEKDEPDSSKKASGKARSRK